MTCRGRQKARDAPLGPRRTRPEGGAAVTGGGCGEWGAGVVGRRDRACPKESALTPFYKEDPEALEQEGVSQGAN